MNREPRAKRRGKRLFNQKCLGSARAAHRVLNRLPFNLGQVRGHSDNRTAIRRKRLAFNLFQKCAKHFFSHFKIRNHAVYKRTNHRDMVRSTSNHFLCFMSNCQNLPCLLVHGRNRGLMKHNALSRNIDKGVTRAKINANVF